MIEEGGARSSANIRNFATDQSYYYHHHHHHRGSSNDGINTSSVTEHAVRTNSNSAMYEEIGNSVENSARFPSSGLHRGPLHTTTTTLPSSSSSFPSNDNEILTSNNNAINVNNNNTYTDAAENDENDGHRSNHHLHHIRNNTNSSNSSNSRIMASTDDDCAYERGYEDVLDKPPKLSDFLINDHCYQRHLLEGKRSVYRGIRGGGEGTRIHNSGVSSSVTNGTSSSSSSSSSGAFLAKLCAGYSFVAMLFLIFISILLETQPLYINGISVKKKMAASSSSSSFGEEKYYYDEEDYKFRRETSNALKAAAAYFLLMVLSLSYIQVKDMNSDLMIHHTAIVGRVCHVRRLVVSAYCRYRRRHYDSIPDGHHHRDDNDGHHDGGLVSILPMMHSSSGENTQLLPSSSSSRQRKNRRNSPRNQLDVEAGSSSGGAGNGGGGVAGTGAMIVVEGVLGKLKSWGIGGGGSSSRRGRKKDK